LAEQDGCCDICCIPFDEAPYNGRICVDHDHRTGTPRGLLCVDCNHGLGKFGDDIMLLLAAADYLSKYANEGVTHNG
jgi:hypothetical protein